jgi:hypothetical protein
MDQKFCKVSRETEIRPDGELWEGSLIFLKRAIPEKRDGFYLIMASIIFSAFALEAYLNHLGKKIYTKKEMARYYSSSVSSQF